MKNLLILLFLFFFISCKNSSVKDPSQISSSSQTLIDKQISAQFDVIQGYFESNGNSKSLKFQIIKEIKNTYDSLIILCETKEISSNWKKTLKNIYAKCESVLSNEGFSSATLNSDIDDFEISSNFRVKISLNELCLLQKIYIVLTCHNYQFPNHRLNIYKLESNKYEVSFITGIDPLNSKLFFATYDSINKKMISEDTSGIKVTNDFGKYVILNKNPKTKFGVLLFRHITGDFEYLPFEMK